MRFERGPYGIIGIETLAENESVVLHALELLQNHTLHYVLPTYSREHNGKTEICIDCTGMERISSIQHVAWKDSASKWECVSAFVLSIIEATDSYLDPDCFVAEEDYVFFDEKASRLMWCYLPISHHHFSQTPLFLRLEKVLMHSFFSDVLCEEDRNQIIHYLSENNEAELHRMLTRQTIESGMTKRKKLLPIRASWLLTQIILMIITLFVIISMKSAISFYTIYVLASLLCLFCIIAYPFEKKEKENNAKEMPRPPCSLTEKDLLFPKISTNNDEIKNKEISYASKPVSPAYLVGMMSESSKNRPLTSVIWVEDFLIGSDELLCDLMLNDQSVSYRHARILHREDVYFVVDLSSTNGTFLNDKRLYSYEEAPLQNNDSLCFGKCRFTFLFESASYRKSTGNLSPDYNKLYEGT